MLQIALSLQNKPLKPHREAPEGLSDPRKDSAQTSSLALTRCYCQRRTYVPCNKASLWKQQEFYLGISFWGLGTSDFFFKNRDHSTVDQGEGEDSSV